MVLLFVSYYSSTNLFFHTHMVDGKYVVHSHFYQTKSDSSPVKKHRHPISTYATIAQLNKVIVEPLCFFAPDLTEYALVTNTFLISETEIQSKTQLSLLPARAPPAC